MQTHIVCTNFIMKFKLLFTLTHGTSSQINIFPKQGLVYSYIIIRRVLIKRAFVLTDTIYYFAPHMDAFHYSETLIVDILLAYKTSNVL